MKLFFFPGVTTTAGSRLGMQAFDSPGHWRRYLGVASAAFVAAAIHGFIMIWLVRAPEPLQNDHAVSLPMIDMVLLAPPAPAISEPRSPPPMEPPKVVKKTTPKSTKKPKPKPISHEEVKRQAEPETMDTVAETPVPSSANSPPGQDRATATPPAKGIFTPARTTADYLNNPKPAYPSLARNRHWEGLVLLRVHVTAEGLCSEAIVQRSSGHELLDESAVEAVRKWHFVPAKRGEVPQASWVTVPIEFKLH